jgi:hypothetical protein
VSFLLAEDEVDSAGQSAGWHWNAGDFLVASVAEVGELEIWMEAAGGT